MFAQIRLQSYLEGKLIVPWQLNKYVNHCRKCCTMKMHQRKSLRALKLACWSMGALIGTTIHSTHVDLQGFQAPDLGDNMLPDLGDNMLPNWLI